MRRFVGPHRFVYVLRHDSAKRHILGGCAQRRGLWPPNSNSGEIFVQCTYPPSFIILCLLVRKLLCRHTNTHKPTNKQTPPITSNALCYATTLGNQWCSHSGCPDNPRKKSCWGVQHPTILVYFVTCNWILNCTSWRCIWVIFGVFRNSWHRHSTCFWTEGGRMDITIFQTWLQNWSQLLLLLLLLLIKQNHNNLKSDSLINPCFAARQINIHISKS